MQIALLWVGAVAFLLILLIISGLILRRHRQEEKAKTPRPAPSAPQPVATTDQPAPPKNYAVAVPAWEADGMTYRLLVVDDMPQWAETIRQFATLFPCHVRHATNLTAALQTVARWQPHVILLDLHMPRDDWQPVAAMRQKYRPNQKTLAFCEQVTTHPKLQDIIVVITSVEDQAEQQEAAVAAGAHHFYTKAEFTVNHLYDLLRQAQLRQQTADTPT